MFCGRCGQENPDDARFCKACGNQMPSLQAAGITTPLTPGPALATAAPNAQPALNIAALPTSEFGGFWMRFVAWILDLLIVSILGAVLGGVLNLARSEPGPAGGAGLLVAAGYQVAAPVLFGAHIGKLVFGYRLVTADGSRLTWGTSLLRYLCSYLSTLAVFIGYIVAGFDSRKQTWHDKIAGTYVVRAVHART